MATIGVSKPHVAKYVNTDGTVTYTDVTKLAKAVQFSAEISSGEGSNNLYADNGVAESDKSFVGGTMTITTDDLDQEGSALLLGLTPKSITVDSKEISELVYDDDAVAPYLGFGCIIKKKRNNAIKWRAVVFTKVMFAIPSDAATTQGETIEWQTSELEATIMRDDSAKHAWKREATFDTEADAEAYIKFALAAASEA